MNEPQDDRQVADKAKQLFDESVDRLDAATLSQLNRNRHAALAEVARTRPHAQWRRLAPVAGVAAAAVVGIILVQGQGPNDVDVAPATATDFEILMDENSIEMFEDLEFYALMDGLEANGNVG